MAELAGTIALLIRGSRSSFTKVRLVLCPVGFERLVLCSVGFEHPHSNREVAGNPAWLTGFPIPPNSPITNAASPTNETNSFDRLSSLSLSLIHI